MAAMDLVCLTVRGNNNNLIVIVSKKVDKKATVRNRQKRKLREVFRLNRPQRLGEYVLIARAAMKDHSYQEIEAEFVRLTDRIK